MGALTNQQRNQNSFREYGTVIGQFEEWAKCAFIPLPQFAVVGQFENR